MGQTTARSGAPPRAWRAHGHGDDSMVVAVILAHESDTVGGRAPDGSDSLESEAAIAIDPEHRYMRLVAVAVHDRRPTRAIGDIGGITVEMRDYGGILNDVLSIYGIARYRLAR